MYDRGDIPTRPTKWCKTCGYVLDGLCEPRCLERGGFG
jgi:hypothetical protein